MIRAPKEAGACRHQHVYRRFRSMLFVGYFLMLCGMSLAQTINRAEYFIDSDPGPGNAIAVTVPSPASTVNFIFNIPTTSLSAGFHTMSFRVRQNGTGFWSHQQSQSFYIAPAGTFTNATSITKAEYFFDADPGHGGATAFAIAPGPAFSLALPISVASLTTGFHTLSIRVRDNLRQWAQVGSQSFYIVPPVPQQNATNLTRAEYFFDADPGNGNAVSLPIAAGSPQSNNVAIPVSSLTTGFHRLGVRYKDNLNKWSLPEMVSFYIIDALSAPPQIVKAEYFVDADPGVGAGINIPALVAGATVDQVVALNMTGVPSGAHTLNLRLKDNHGLWSNFLAADFTVLNCTPPAAPSAAGVSRCGIGAVTLNATGATGGRVYRWYADGVTSTILFTGTPYITPALGATTTYFVSIYDPSTLCESTRKSVTATINIVPKPTLNLTGSLTLCEGNTVTLAAPPGFVGYAWSNGLTTQQIVVATTGSYTATVSNGTCSSSASDPFVLNILPKPAKPTIQSSGGGSICGGGSVSLTAPAGFANYRWSSGQNTQVIVVTSPGSFSVVVTDASGCQSDASDIADVTSSAPSQPNVVVTGNTNLCPGDFVTLTAPAGFSAYHWSTGETSAVITVNASGNYAVTVGNASGCVSPASDTVTVQSFSIPAKPVVVITGSTTLCLGSFVLLAAPPGFAAYQWSSGETSQKIFVSTSGDYAVAVGNVANCLSPFSDVVAVSESNQPCGGTVPGNHPPEIKTTIANTTIKGKVTLNLADLVSDEDGNLDASSLRITDPPGSGAIASIDSQMNLVVDYSNISFSGIETVTIQVCDLAASCTEQQITIDVAGDIEAFNAVSPNGDGKNETLFLEYIDIIPETKNNQVTIYDRWGGSVFKMTNYDNVDRVFKGLDNEARELPNGTYYYKIEFSSGKKSKTGFISLRR